MIKNILEKISKRHIIFENVSYLDFGKLYRRSIELSFSQLSSEESRKTKYDKDLSNLLMRE